MPWYTQATCIDIIDSDLSEELEAGIVRNPKREGIKKKKEYPAAI